MIKGETEMPNNPTDSGHRREQYSGNGPEMIPEFPTEQCICAEKSPYPFVWDGEQQRKALCVPFPIL